MGSFPIDRHDDRAIIFFVSDEILVSFDVVSLFTCIPTHLAIEVVKERLDFDQSLPERTNLSIQNIVALLQFVFVWNLIKPCKIVKPQF